MSDFFISYTGADTTWAEWIAYVLEEASLSVVIQAWDFRPGSNFVLEMQRAAAAAKRTLMVLSPDYLLSRYAAPEWASAFKDDPGGLAHALVPIKVRQCQVVGLLAPLVHINLVGLAEDDARTALLAGLNPGRNKPPARPAFPGTEGPAALRDFPGAPTVSAAPARAGAYLPRLTRAATDIDIRRFMKDAFQSISAYFENALPQLIGQSEGLDFEFERLKSTEFTAEVFRHGKSVAACRVWQGGLTSTDGISYAEGRNHLGDNSCNEILGISSREGPLTLSAMMGTFGFGRQPPAFDLKALSPAQGAEYLWRRFVARLER